MIANASTNSGDRPMGARYRLPAGGGTWWELGWDKPLGTFYAHQLRNGPAGEELTAMHGADLRELPTVADLGTAIDQPIPPGIAADLDADAAAHPFQQPPRFYAYTKKLDTLRRHPAPPGIVEHPGIS